MSNPTHDQIAELADQANDQNEKAGNPERVDIVFTTEAEMLKASLRTIHHQVLDKLLDACEAAGYDIGEATIIAKVYKVSDDEDATIEDICSFNAELASGAVEEMYADRFVYHEGVVDTKQTKRTPIS